MRTNLTKLTGTRFVVAAFAAVLALALMALPARADFKVSQANFVLDCNTATSAAFGGGFVGDGVVGTVTVPAGNQLEVFNFGGGTGTITVDCIVTLGGEDSELNLAEGTDLLFREGDDDYKNFTILAAGAGFEIEIQVMKNSRIVAQDFTITITGAEEAEAQFEENFCLTLHGDLSITMGTATDEGGDVQLKKFDASSGTALCGFPNINVGGDITLTVEGSDSEIQIEEFNHLKAGGDDGISLTSGAFAVKSQVQTKKNVRLEAVNGDITLTALGLNGEVQAEENNDFDADGDILLSTGADGKLEVKKFSDFDAGGDIDIVPGAGTVCKIEAVITGAWSPDGSPGLVTAGCILSPSL